MRARGKKPQRLLPDSEVYLHQMKMRIAYPSHLEGALGEIHFQPGHMLSQATKLGKCTGNFQKKNGLGISIEVSVRFEDELQKKPHAHIHAQSTDQSIYRIDQLQPPAPLKSSRARAPTSFASFVLTERSLLAAACAAGFAVR